MKFLIIFFLLTSVCFAGEIQYCDPDGKNCPQIIYDDKYSLKDFTTETLLTATDMEGITIFGSCFSKEIPDTKVFPDVKELTLVNCNLDNVYLKKEWVVIGWTPKRFLIQNDWMAWIVDEDNKPIEPIEKETFIKLGISIKPEDIPKTKLPKSITDIKDEELAKGK
jgi:hypothetical protein